MCQINAIQGVNVARALRSALPSAFGRLEHGTGKPRIRVKTRDCASPSRRDARKGTAACGRCQQARRAQTAPGAAQRSPPGLAVAFSPLSRFPRCRDSPPTVVTTPRCRDYPPLSPPRGTNDRETPSGCVTSGTGRITLAPRAPDPSAAVTARALTGNSRPPRAVPASDWLAGFEWQGRPAAVPAMLCGERAAAPPRPCVPAVSPGTEFIGLSRMNKPAGNRGVRLPNPHGPGIIINRAEGHGGSLLPGGCAKQDEDKSICRDTNPIFLASVSQASTGTAVVEEAELLLRLLPTHGVWPLILCHGYNC
ncbi:uncharacterized protein LOC120324985 [Pipra filicauda]|uniref:Uncharacterized protein LOC120324985 n=1 Tax=Pipra filicauda TaxID=649802 RepID=A0A7R5KZD9_9PASS|nr:uncharacterized protein LOC120324985 [Pipra filicauda]